MAMGMKYSRQMKPEITIKKGMMIWRNINRSIEFPKGLFV
jgi:hypothetical protein